MGKQENAEKKRKRFRLPKLSLEDDIRYRGPLSYQHFQIFGWICIVSTFVILMMNLACKVNGEMTSRLSGWIEVLRYAADMSLPFLLVANFSLILNNRNGYRKQIVKNGAAMLGITLVFILFFNKYILGTFRLISDAPETVRSAVTDMIRGGSRDGFLAFNIFVDLFLCNIFLLFLNYQPKRIFKGKWRYVFRLFALLPVAYEAASIYAKIMASLGKNVIPVECYPLLTVKPPMTFVLFIVMTVFIKTRELRFRRHGKTHEEYKQFLQTNRNSLHFSVFAAIAMLITGILDFLILVYGSAFVSVFLAGGEEATERIMDALNVMLAVGFGNSVVLAFLAPVMLLYSYTRIPKNPKISTLIPMAGAVLIVLVFIQGLFQILNKANLPKLNLTEIGVMVQQLFNEIRGR